MERGGGLVGRGGGDSGARQALSSRAVRDWGHATPNLPTSRRPTTSRQTTQLPNHQPSNRPTVTSGSLVKALIMRSRASTAIDPSSRAHFMPTCARHRGQVASIRFDLPFAESPGHPPSRSLVHRGAETLLGETGTVSSRASELAVPTFFFKRQAVDTLCLHGCLLVPWLFFAWTRIYKRSAGLHLKPVVATARSPVAHHSHPRVQTAAFWPRSVRIQRTSPYGTLFSGPSRGPSTGPLGDLSGSGTAPERSTRTRHRTLTIPNTKMPRASGPHKLLRATAGWETIISGESASRSKRTIQAKTGQNRYKTGSTG